MASRKPSFPQFIPCSDQSLLVRFTHSISERSHNLVARLSDSLLRNPPRFVSNIHPAYSSILLSFNPLKTDHGELQRRVSSILSSFGEFEKHSSDMVEIPVCYDREFGIDLKAVAEHCRLTVDELIRVHSSATYTVYFLGFSPGFAYLGGMSPLISTPRLSSPRKHVSAGSVAIGGDQTGVYPLASPGGWRIIGRTPLRLFDVERKQPSFLWIGDLVQFKSISRQEFENLASANDPGELRHTRMSTKSH